MVVAFFCFGQIRLDGVFEPEDQHPIASLVRDLTYPLAAVQSLEVLSKTTFRAASANSSSSDPSGVFVR